LTEEDRQDKIGYIYELLAQARDRVQELEDQLRELGEEPLA
jgi:hypothetical protein